MAQRLSRAPHDVVQGLEELLQQLKATEKQLLSVTEELARVRAKQLVAEAKRLNGCVLITAHIEGADRQLLSALADAIKGQLGSGAAVLACADSRAVAWVMVVTPDVVKRGVHAGQLLKVIAAVTGGGGGGRPDFAQAGGKDPVKIPEALRKAEQLLRGALERSKEVKRQA